MKKGGGGRRHWAASEAFFGSETVSKIPWREESLSELYFGGFYLPVAVSLSFVQFDFRAGLFSIYKKQ